MVETFTTVIAAVVIVASFIERRRVAKARADVDTRYTTLLNNSKSRDQILDCVLRTFNLHVSDPYTVRPGFEEKRCLHCNYPVGYNHAPDCIWMKLQPYVQKLYRS